MFKIVLFNKKFIFTVLAMILLSMSVFARGYESDNFNRRNGVYGRKLPDIQLTSEQMSQIQIIRLEMSKETP